MSTKKNCTGNTKRSSKHYAIKPQTQSKKEFLDPIQNQHKDIINFYIQQIITLLQDTFDRITDQKLSGMEDKLKETNYNPAIQFPIKSHFFKILASLQTIYQKQELLI